MWRVVPWLALVAWRWSGDAAAQTLDDTWTVTVGGQSVKVNSDGSFRVPNVTAADLFGPDGPGTQPDFSSDVYVRLTGFRTYAGETRYVYGPPFRFRNGDVYRVSDLTFTDQPPPIVESIAVEASKTLLTRVGETSQLRVTGRMRDGTTRDLTKSGQWTSYRTSNPNIVGVDRDGTATGRGLGVCFVTAQNEGATAVVRVGVLLGSPTTTVVGQIEPMPVGVRGRVTIGAADWSSSTEVGSDGRLSVAEVPAGLGPLEVVASLIGAEQHWVGWVTNVAPVTDGWTDAGWVRVMPLLGTNALFGLRMFSADLDRNGRPDGFDDPDFDRLPNAAEFLAGTNPDDPDSDNDGASDADQDLDRDGWPTLLELGTGTSPLNPDSDGDGWRDGIEIAEETDPLSSRSRPRAMAFDGSGVRTTLRRPGVGGGIGFGVVVGTPAVRTSVRRPGGGSDSGFGVVVGSPVVRVRRDGAGAPVGVATGDSEDDVRVRVR